VREMQVGAEPGSAWRGIISLRRQWLDAVMLLAV